MKLLLDQNLSPRLVARLASLFPGTAHVSTLGLDRATDSEVWEYAHLHSFTLVTKDADFSDMNTLRGFPPKVIWLRIGNCPTMQIEDLLRRHKPAIDNLEIDPKTGILELM